MRSASILFVIIILLASCSTIQPAETTIPMVIGTVIQPRITSTSTKTPTRANPTSTLPILIIPSPTPFLYSVVINDTPTGIAFKFNVSLEALLEANPSINYEPLIVGQKLVIPSADTSERTPTTKPAPVQISQVNCLKNQDTSLACLVLLENEFTGWIQNLSIQIQLIDPSGKLLDTCEAYPPLDLLPPGKSIVLSCSFPKSPNGNYLSYASVISAISIPFPNDRYLDISIRNPLVEIYWDGLTANVLGEIVLNTKNQDANRVWILAIAFNKEGKVVGFRRWESTTTLSPGNTMPFELKVASMDSEIDQVELIVEGTR
jgi:LysM repeat protein